MRSEGVQPSADLCRGTPETLKKPGAKKIGRDVMSLPILY